MNTGSSKWLAGIGLLVVVLIVASVLVVVLGNGNSIHVYPEGTPEGVVQRYLDAVNDGDPSLTLSYMESRARESCTLQEISQQTQWFVENAGRRRIELIDTRDLAAGQKQVRVRVTEVYVSPPFSVDESSYEQWYTLIEEDGSWVLEYPAWPVSYCRNVQESIEARP